MKKAYGLDAKKYQTILTNHLDRLVDFYTTLYAVKTENQDLKDYLSSARKFLISDLIDKGLSLGDIKKYNIEEEALDIFQVNFSYNRKIQNTILTNGNQEEKDKYKQISAIIYELGTGHNVCTHSDGGFSIEEDDFPIGYKDMFSILKVNFPCLHQILVSDILKSPPLDELIPLINNSIKSNRRVRIDKEVKETAMSDMIKLTEFYPERLFLGLRYVFPETHEKLPYCELGFSMHHLTPDNEIEQALRDVRFQHNKFKAYYHHHESPSETTFQLDRAKSLSLLPCRNNKYIKQLNSIENTFMALCAWRMVHLTKTTRAEAIDAVFKRESQRNKIISTHQEAESKKKIRDRLTNIEKFIQEKQKHLESLSERYRIMHPEYHSQEVIEQFYPKE